MTSRLESFDTIYERAVQRKGGVKQLEQRLSKPLNEKQLIDINESRYLSEFSKKIFQSGFVWRVVEQKWENFEELFFQFNVNKILMIPPDMLDRKASDERIIRNHRKVKSIQNNALMIDEINRAEGSFVEWIARWPVEDITGLWQALKKQGDRLGGNTGPYALRTLGKDTFLLSRDVEAYFRNQKLIDGGLTAKRTQRQIQDCFNQWASESGRSLQEISQAISYGVGDNFV